MTDATDDASMLVKFKLGTNFGISKLVKFRVLYRNERVFGKNILNISGNQLRPTEQACVVQTDDIDGLIGAVAQLQQRAAGIKRYSVFNARYAAHFVENIIGKRNGVGNSLDRRIHHPDRSAYIDDRGRSARQYPGKKRRHLNHQKDSKRNTDQKRRKFRAIIDQKLVGDLQDSRRRHKTGRCFPCRLGDRW